MKRKEISIYFDPFTNLCIIYVFAIYVQYNQFQRE